MELLIARSIVLWIAIWLSFPTVLVAIAILIGKSSQDIGWMRLGFVSFLWALFFLLGAL